MQPYALGIPVKNEESTIEHVLKNALEQDNPPVRIYVCVNGSTDHTSVVVQNFAFRCHRVIPLISEPGKANAWNSIISQSIQDGLFGDVMVFCDGDICIPSKSTLGTLVQCTRESTNIMLGASTIQLPSQGQSHMNLVARPDSFIV